MTENIQILYSVNSKEYKDFIERIKVLRKTIFERFPCRKCGFCCGLEVMFYKNEIDPSVLQYSHNEDTGIIFFKGCPFLKDNLCVRYDQRFSLCHDFPILINLVWDGSSILGLKDDKIIVKSINHCYISNEIAKLTGNEISLSKDKSPPYIDLHISLDLLEAFFNN